MGGLVGDGPPGILRLLHHRQLDSHRRNASLPPHPRLHPPDHAQGPLGAPELVARFSHSSWIVWRIFRKLDSVYPVDASLIFPSLPTMKFLGMYFSAYFA